MPAKIISRHISSGDDSGQRVDVPSVLVSESNHRIANNLTLVSAMLRLHVRQIRAKGLHMDPQRACDILGEVGARIEAVGQLHRLLATDGDCAVDLRNYFRHIGQSTLRSMASDREFAFSVISDNAFKAPPDKALPLGLMVAELVTNAIKYAHPAAGVKGRIELGCYEQASGDVTVWVSDDGVGLPEGFDAERGGGLGMRTLRALAKQVDAKLFFESVGLGLTVRIGIPASSMRLSSTVAPETPRERDRAAPRPLADQMGSSDAGNSSSSKVMDAGP